jgi:hypothetical protein
MPLSVSNNFTGFIATYFDGTVVEERLNVSGNKLERKCRTNWYEVDKEKLKKLELYWVGTLRASIDKEDHPTLSHDDWYFSHTGYMDMKDRKVKVLTRNIGYKENGLLTILSVDEESGTLKVDTRAK